MSQHQTWAHWIVLVGLGLIFAGWCYMLFHEAEQLATITNHDQYVRRAWYILLAEFPRTIWIFAGSCVVLYLHFGDLLAAPGESVIHSIAWPWYLPTGTGITVPYGIPPEPPEGNGNRYGLSEQLTARYFVTAANKR